MQSWPVGFSRLFEIQDLRQHRLDQIHGLDGWITNTVVVIDMGMSDNKRENVKPAAPLAEPGNKILKREALQNARESRRLNLMVNGFQAANIILEITLEPSTRIHFLINVVENNIITTHVPRRREKINITGHGGNNSRHHKKEFLRKAIGGEQG